MKALKIHIENIHLHLPSDNGVKIEGVILPFQRAANAVDAPRFELSADGQIVTDHKTGIAWPVYESEKAYNFDDAEKYIKSFNLGGFTDWANPSDEQRLSIVDRSRDEPALFEPLKSRHNSYEWTSTPVSWRIEKGVPGAFWQVSSYYGFVNDAHRTLEAFVRPCRVVARPGQ